ncbi:MAG: cephalosporin hydroxylase family protein [Sulfuricaulis sp.]|uniref:cephalosporin hydroxylase family protein n=1 Tax=Sulfuricaulis sp. TaxID=2003553 RepID=UPI0025CFB262|nr:cephalosporin hydroxylase family protein [Sulfuricaulis sp.]MCR4346779.1 cephalosporin hydroxylase family protein [Sulfuricaulis sp.]
MIEGEKEEIEKMGQDTNLQSLSRTLFVESCKHRYSYHFSWLGRPIIQYPEDIIAIQEIIWNTKPDLIVETGVAHGGSIIFHASMLELLGGNGIVVGIDIDIRKHNRNELEKHPLSKRVTLIEGSSIDTSVVSQVRQLAQGRKRIMVLLDSNHTHEHVLQELKLYSPLVASGNYLIVLDTVIEDLPKSLFPDRPWDRNDNPKTAVHEFLKLSDRFIIDKEIQNKLLLSVAPDGYLKCIKD